MADSLHSETTDPKWSITLSRRALFEAVDDDKESVVRELISAGIDLNMTYKKGKTILYLAVRKKNERMVKLLIDAGADVNIRYDDGKTALFNAVENSDESMVDLLISNGADVNIKTSGRYAKTPLSYAVDKCNESIVDKLIKAGADVNEIYGFHDNALIMAIREHNNSIISRLIDAGGDVNIIDGNGGTPICYTTMFRRDVTMIFKLIDAGADVNTPTYLDRSGFHFALNPFFRYREEEQTLRIVQKFVQDGNADVNKRDDRGRTPLFYSREASVTSYLIKKGANLSHRDNCNVSVLTCYLEPIMSNYELRKDPSLSCDMVQNLLRHGVQKEAVFEAIINLLFAKALTFYSSYNKDRDRQASFYKMLELAKDFVPRNWISYLSTRLRNKRSLIQQLINMLKNEANDATSYYESIAPRILATLIDLGASPDSVDLDGNTALHYAASLGSRRDDVSQETVLKICHQLRFVFGASLHISNYKNQTPLLFCFSRYGMSSYTMRGREEFRILVEVCQFLLDHGASVEDATQEGVTVFHCILDLFDKYLNPHRHNFSSPQESEHLQELIKLCKLFFNPKVAGNKEFAVNKRTANGLSSALHKWASLELGYQRSTDNYSKTLFKDYTFEKVLKLILMRLVNFGAKLNDRNKDDQTPLHLCRTWTAMNLLLDVGANPNVIDSSGCSPLLTAAKRNWIEAERFCPDVVQEPVAFWRTVLGKGLDPWTVDNDGESVLSVLIRSGEYVLSKALLEVARDDKYIQVDTIASPLLNAICKDENTRTHWKSNLVEIILKSRRDPLFGSLRGSPLHLCCKNIVECFKDDIKTPDIVKEIPLDDDDNYNDRPHFRRHYHYHHDIDDTDHDDDDGVHWTIAKLLLAYGADVNVPDTNGQSCLDIAEDCPRLKELLLSPLDVDEVPLLIPWTSVSRTHKAKLARVARRQESKHVESFWYHQDLLQSGTFGAVFAGINEKDGREVAIKRMEKRHMQRPEDKREITNLTVLADCQQVVRYLCFFEDEYFSYVVLELMEGNLEECLSDVALKMELREQICQDVVHGLKFLHALNIVHRDLKPTNILYRTYPKLCLKIADFGLSRRIDSASTTVYGTNAGTRCWIAPEVLKSAKHHSKSSDVFACGLVLHYILSKKKHPFASADCANKNEWQIIFETEANLISDKLEGWDDSLSPEATHLVRKMLECDERRRPSAEVAPSHPLFWSKRKKIDLLVAVGNQNPEFACPRAKRCAPVSAVEMDVETGYGTILRAVAKWDDPRNANMPVLYSELTRKRSPYDTFSVVELVRFIRNAYAHVTELSRPNMLLEDYVFLEYFPDLVMEVYKAVTTHGWDQAREEIKHILDN